jgi:hypothetical protein
MPAKKNKKEDLLKKDHPPQSKMKEKLHIKLINNHMEGSRCHHLMEEYQCLHHIMKCADASMGGWAAMPPPPPPYMAPNEAFMAPHPNQCKSKKGPT